MSPKIQTFLKTTIIYDLVLASRGQRRIKEWEREGYPSPAPEYFKQRLVKKYGALHGLQTFVETGTFYGNMVYAVRRQFREIYSIELDRVLYEAARERFKQYPHIQIIHGDSGRTLREILVTVSEPCLFWLDAHYSGASTAKGSTETPIKEELASILTHPVSNHVMLIDDARCFSGRNGYPTVEELRGYVKMANKPYSFSVEHDIIRIIGSLW